MQEVSRTPLEEPQDEPLSSKSPDVVKEQPHSLNRLKSAAAFNDMMDMKFQKKNTQTEEKIRDEEDKEKKDDGDNTGTSSPSKYDRNTR